MIDFVGRIKLTNEIFDLTVEEVAKKEDIYNKEIQVQFVKKIRDEKKFDNIDALVKQLHEDRKNITKSL